MQVPEHIPKPDYVRDGTPYSEQESKQQMAGAQRCSPRCMPPRRMLHAAPHVNPSPETHMCGTRHASALRMSA